MKNNGKTSNQPWQVFWSIWIFALAASMVFTMDKGLTDVWTVPKWIYGGWILSVGLLIFSLYLLIVVGEKIFSWQTVLLEGGLPILLVCSLEAVLIVVQAIMDVPLFEGCGCGSFENAAGGSACLVLGMTLPVRVGGKWRLRLVTTLHSICAVGVLVYIRIVGFLVWPTTSAIL